MIAGNNEEVKKSHVHAGASITSAIRECVALGLRNQDIEKKMPSVGKEVIRVLAHLERERLGLPSQRDLNNDTPLLKAPMSFSKKVYDKLHREAKDRRTTPEALTRRIMGIVVRDNLFDALIDGDPVSDDDTATS